MKIIKYFTAISMLLFLVTSLKAEEQSTNIYALPAIFTSSNNSETFKDLLNSNRQYFVDTFIDYLKQKFPNTIESISDKQKYKTFVTYVSIPRVSQNNYEKENLVEIFLPMTASIYFINAATWEIIYSYPFTQYAQYKTTLEKLNNVEQSEEINKLYLSTYKTLISEIINKASIEFKPFNISAKVVDKYSNIYILDKGTSNGIAKGDLLTAINGSQLSVMYSDLNYCICEALIGSFIKGDEVSKFANGSLGQLKKPKALFINNFDGEKLYNIFATALGTSAVFSLITIDKTFYDMQEAMVSLNDNFRTENMQNRTTPEYYIKLFITKPLYVRYPSNKDYGFIDKYSVIVCGYVFDKTGHIIFSKCVDEEIIDNTIENIKFSKEARFDVLIKNALIKLAESFSSEIKFKQETLNIIKIEDNKIYLSDNNGLLSFGKAVSVFKKIKIKNTEYLIPIKEYKVVGFHEDGTAICKFSKSFVDDVPAVNKKDVAVVGSLSKGKNSGNMFVFDSTKTTFKGNEIEIKNFKEIAFLALASSMKSPIKINTDDFQNQVDELNSGYGFRNKIEISKDDNSKLKIKVAYKINLLQESVEKNNLLKREYKITVGLLSKNEEKILGQKGINQNITIYIPKENNEDIISYELLKAIYPLIQQLAVDF